jgi:AraC family transcriptional regulator
MATPRTAFSQGRFYGVSTVERQLPSVRVAHLSATISAEGVEEHSHDDAHFVLATHGRYLTTAWGPETEGPPLVFNPPGVVHRDRFVAAGGHFLAVSFEAAAWRDLAGQDPTAGDALRLTGVLARTCALRLTRAILTRDVEPLALESLGLELAAQVQAPKRDSDHRPGWLALAETYLADAFDQPIAVADVARAAGVHPVHLARGTRRLERAADLLMLGGAPLGEVALRAGFCDQSHLNRQFRLAYGVTPGEFARLCGRRPDVANVQDGRTSAI